MPEESVRGVVRKRTLNNSELKRGNYSIIETDRSTKQLSIQNPSSSIRKEFTFDAVYPDDSSQRLIYDETAFPLVESVLKGYNSTIFAYGQTGCGKTFTMLGVPSNPELSGIIPNSFSHIFGCIAESAHEKTFLVRCSYCEIYNEQIRDLLDYRPNVKLELKETKEKGIFIKNLSLTVVKNLPDIELAMENGNKHRITKGTNMNEQSSRSHAVFTIYIETSETIENRQVFKAGKLNLVDLAGSERQKKTGVSGEQLKEATEINLSLSALGNVISALVDGKVTHVPYRDSKLTRLLQDSLGGNTKTVMIAVVSPADYNYDESLSTLRYASRAKHIQNKPKVNEDPKDALLRQYAEEITRLKKMLENHQQDNRLEKQLSIVKEGVIIGGENTDEALQEKLKAQRAFRTKLKKQKLREKQLIKEKNELLIKEKKYDSLQEEVEFLRKHNAELQLKEEANVGEIDDLNHEFEIEKELMLGNIRDLEHECGFMIKVLGNIMPSAELDKVRRMSKFNEDNHYWKVPPFYLQNKQVILPKIGKAQASEMIANDVKDKVVVFNESKPLPTPQPIHKHQPVHKPQPKDNKYLVTKPVNNNRGANSKTVRAIKLEPLKKEPKFKNSDLDFNTSV